MEHMNPSKWLAICILMIAISACNSQVTRVTQIVPVTRIVRVTQIIPATHVTQVVQPTPIEVTRIVLAAPIVEVTRIVEAPPVEVTRVVLVTQLVEVPPNPPPPTKAPINVTASPLSLVSEGLLIWYDFEDDFQNSGIVTDFSGNGFNAQVNGVVETTEGISGGRAIYFTGNSYLQAPINPVAGRNTVSFSLWFRTENPGENYKFASAAWWQGGPGSGWVLGTHIPEFWSNDGQSLYLPDLTNMENNFPFGGWVHEVITYDGSRIKEYTNGQLVNDWLTTGAAMGDGVPMVIGGWPNVGGFYFVGDIDEFQVFAQSLTSEEVIEIFNRGR